MRKPATQLLLIGWCVVAGVVAWYAMEGSEIAVVVLFGLGAVAMAASAILLEELHTARTSGKNDAAPTPSDVGVGHVPSDDDEVAVVIDGERVVIDGRVEYTPIEEFEADDYAGCGPGEWKEKNPDAEELFDHD